MRYNSYIAVKINEAIKAETKPQNRFLKWNFWLSAFGCTAKLWIFSYFFHITAMIAKSVVIPKNTNDVAKDGIYKS